MADGFEMTWDGDVILAAIKGATMEGLELAAEHLLRVSRGEVPIEEATLERSGTASVDTNDRAAAVSYDTEYAVRQHEDMTLRHDAGRKSKFLEDPFNQESDTMLELIAAAGRRKLGG